MKYLLYITLIFCSLSIFAHDFIGNCNRQYMHDILPVAGNFDELNDELNIFHIKVAQDSRKIYSTESPEYLETYGRITLDDAECTGNIIANSPTQDASIVTTAAHCFEDTNQREVSIVFTKRNGEKIVRTAKVAEINFQQDYAILKLNKKISHHKIKPLVLSDEILESLMFDEHTMLTGGYSGDVYKGQEGENLTYDPNCHIKDTSDPIHIWTDCIMYPGASGGAVVINVIRDGQSQHFLIGVNHAIGYNYETKQFDPQSSAFININVIHDALEPYLK